ncbi:hypothetical protein OF117_16850 [Geodermatophilus sp. YIM 151500]|uniref:hypothetical protein n=1 Tax=Geodermatophilus sp. YIM 151500 TaxID=2984531 RepID=UPI0021E41739|nr:hypothetical protein [Geodermatophilus sp. YIM 151500]MCV2491025.1 hypothetical protein [Geodermatophilus sp. YIM 151500]
MRGGTDGGPDGDGPHVGGPDGGGPDDEAAWLAALRPSRIRQVQAGAPAWTRVELVDVDTGHGPVLRDALEAFGIRVDRTAIGQARHLVAALTGGERAPYVVLACHGDEGAIVLPELAEEVERWQPFHGRLGPADLRSFARFDGATVIATGCDTGHPDLARAVLDCGAAAYVAPAGGPFGYASLFAPVFLFYELVEGRTLEQAVGRLQAHDRELAMWRLVT